MALGGGTWLTQNKKLPGYYHNVISLKRASAELSDRGIAAVPLNLSWGKEGEVFLVERNDFQKNSMKIFGYDYTAPEMWSLREIFKHAIKVYCYRLKSTPGSEESDPSDILKKASNKYATAKYPGSRGNNIKLVIEKDIDDDDKYVVSTFVDYTCYDIQTVTTAAELKDNDWIDFKKESSVTLEATTGTPLTGGTDGTPRGADYQSFLTAIEAYGYNTLCCPTTESTVVDLFVSFAKSQREDYGSVFSLVAWKPEKADYEGVIGVWNKATHGTIENVPEQALLYWVAGAQAGCAINKTLTNMAYDGELTVDVDLSQSELEAAIREGKFMLHNVDGDVRVLEDINTLVSLTDTKGDIFQSNQTMRVADQISNDIAVLFNTNYLGKVQNDKAGRSALWNDVVCYHRELERLRAIEDFDPEIITCELGNTKKSVVLTTNGLNVVNAMSQLYMTTVMQ